MDKKQFVKGLLLRLIPLAVLIVAAVVMAVCGIKGDWVGWYAVYAVIFAAMVFVVIFAVKNGTAVAANSIRNSMRQKEAALALAKWQNGEYNKANVVCHGYQSERDFDTTMFFYEENIKTSKILRDEDNMVTGETQTQTLAYENITALAVVDVAGLGSPHIRYSFSDGNILYSYFDVDLARFLQEKTSMELEGIEDLKKYYLSVMAEADKK